MIILRQNFYSNEEVKKLKFKDRLNTWATKGELKDQLIMTNPKTSEEEFTKANRRNALRMAGYTGAGFAAGAGIGHLLSKDKKIAPWQVALGIGMTTGAPVGGYLGRKRLRKQLKDNKNEKLKKRVDRQNDAIKVKLGDMTAKEFERKWYKDENKK
jgi:hypothetical protein